MYTLSVNGPYDNPDYVADITYHERYCQEEDYYDEYAEEEEVERHYGAW